MNKCCNDYPYWWNYCESTNLNQFVTHSELEEALESISGDCDCDLSGITAQIEAIEGDMSGVTAQIEALQGNISTLSGEVSTLDEKVAQKANESAITAIWEAISGLTARVEALESGSTPTPDPTPTPDTGDTPTFDKKLVVNISGGTTYELDCDDDDHLDETQAKGTGTTYMLYQSAVIGDCITQIGNSAFMNCFNMSEITLPSGITQIHNHAFGTSYIGMPVTHLDVIINTVVPPLLNNDAESGNYFFPIDCTVYVPAESVNAYKTAWPDYANIIQAIQ